MRSIAWQSGMQDTRLFVSIFCDRERSGRHETRHSRRKKRIISRFSAHHAWLALPSVRARVSRAVTASEPVPGSQFVWKSDKAIEEKNEGGLESPRVLFHVRFRSLVLSNWGPGRQATQWQNTRVVKPRKRAQWGWSTRVFCHRLGAVSIFSKTWYWTRVTLKNNWY